MRNIQKYLAQPTLIFGALLAILHQHFAAGSGAVPGNPKHLSNQLARTAQPGKEISTEQLQQSRLR